MLAQFEIEHLKRDFFKKYPDGDFEHRMDWNCDYYENREILNLDKDIDDDPTELMNELNEQTNKLMRRNHAQTTTINRLKKEKSKLKSKVEQKIIKEEINKKVKEDLKEMIEFEVEPIEPSLKDLTDNIKDEWDYRPLKHIKKEIIDYSEIVRDLILNALYPSKQIINVKTVQVSNLTMTEKEYNNHVLAWKLVLFLIFIGMLIWIFT